MQIGSTDFEFRPRAASWAERGLRYIGFGTLFAVESVVFTAVFLNEYLNEGMSWAADKLGELRLSLIKKYQVNSSEKELTSRERAESQEVSQTRIDEESESEHQADSDDKLSEVSHATNMDSESEHQADEVSKEVPQTVGDLIKKQYQKREAEELEGYLSEMAEKPDDTIPFDEVTDEPNEESKPKDSEGEAEEKSEETSKS